MPNSLGSAYRIFLAVCFAGFHFSIGTLRCEQVFSNLRADFLFASKSSKGERFFPGGPYNFVA